MLLRRFTQHVNDQNWFAVVLDFLIVVLGIYIGLQVDALRVTQKERVMERQYLERILLDMDSSIGAQLEEFKLEESGIAAMDVFAASLARGSFTEEDKAATIEALNYIGWVVLPVTKMITIRELQSSGNISLIQSIEIRNTIGQLELSFAMAKHSAEQTSAVLNASQAEIIKWSYMPPSETGQWGYETNPDYDYLLTVNGAHKIVSTFSGWFKYHSSLLRAHHEDTIALRDLVKQILAANDPG